MEGRVAHLLVDEVFDADRADFQLIRVHCEAGAHVTVAGDVWQALYEFRKAKPLKVREGLGRPGFEPLTVHTSHRYTQDQTRDLAIALRSRAVTVPPAEDPSVAIALNWDHLGPQDRTCCPARSVQ
ncbi:MAG: UvrD-helicase domain-containing protein [Ilumatobacteraceae bacterium]